MKKLIYRLAAVFSLLVSTWSAWRMYSLNQQQQLWGHLPLWFFLGLWGGVFFLLLSQNSHKPLALRKLWLAALSGVLLWAAFPPMPFAFLAFGAFLPLFYVDNLLDEEVSKKSRFFPFLYLAFVLWNVLSTYWIANSALLAGATAILINSFFMTLPWLAWRWTKRNIPGVGLFILPAYWLAFEYVHFHWQISWPWLSLGHVFALYPALVQWYEYTGVLGGTLWVWLGNLVLWQLLPFLPFGKWRELKNNFTAEGKSKARLLLEKLLGRPFPPVLIPVLQAVLVFLLPAGLSLNRYYTYQERNGSGEEVEVVVVQPNFEPHYEKFSTPQQIQLDTFLALADRLVSDSTDYLVFPETSFGNIRDDRIGKEPLTRHLQAWLEKHPRVKLLTGLAAYHVFVSGEPHSPYVREMRSSRGETVYWEAYNAAVQLQAGQSEVVLYRKSKLVPGAEFLPYRKLLFFFKPLVDKLGGSIGGYAPQEKRVPFFCAEKQLAVGTQICYESIYGEYSTGYVREGAGLLFIMTNDGWWDNTPGHRQHLWLGRLRAIELRRDIARSANTGISAFINQRGNISQATPYGKTAVIKARLNPNDALTFYARYGDLIGRLAAFVSVLFLFIAVVNRYTSG